MQFETIEREGNKYYAVTSRGREEITSFVSGKTRVLVKDGDGNELVIDKDGNLMGVEEYKKCGGSKALLRENIREKDSQVTKNGNVKFYSAGNYLFDTYDNYTGKTGYAERFPSIGEGDYRPAYACAESRDQIEIKAEPYENITFKTERGVPVLCKDGILTVTARGERDTTSIYAYDAENHIVGKVNVLSYDKVTRKICLVPVGNSKAPDAAAAKQELDKIFAKLMVDFDVTIGEPITIPYSKGKKFTHGGSGIIGVYNTDQKAAISKLKERGVDEETVYLFLVKECKAFKANDSADVVAGYMPRGYQFGFIYNELNNFRTVAHEICHGAFHLKHTFDANDFLAPEGQTDNLMDYNHGRTLNHWQWKDVHQPKSVRFKWLQEEEEGEAKGVIDFISTELTWATIPYAKRISPAFAKQLITKYNYDFIQETTSNWGRLQSETGHNYTLETILDLLKINDSFDENASCKLNELSLMSEKEVKEIFENGDLIGVCNSTGLKIGLKTFLSNEISNRVLDTFYSKNTTTDTQLRFDIDTKISQDLHINSYFQQDYLAKRVIPFIYAHLEEPDKLSDIAKEANTPNFSRKLDLMTYDYYALMGGTQKIIYNISVYKQSSNRFSKVYYLVKMRISIQDSFSSDFDDIYGTDRKMFSKHNMSCLNAFFWLQFHYNYSPFITDIEYQDYIIFEK